MKRSIESMRAAATALLTIAVLVSTGAADNRLKAPLPAVNYALMGTTSPTNSIVPTSDGLRLPSASRARIWSTAGVLLPIAVGGIIWRTQSRKQIVEYGAQYGPPGQPYRERSVAPNRTLPYSVMAAGVVLGPSVGYFYGGCTSRGIEGILTRTFVGGGTVGLVYVVASSIECPKYGNRSGIVAAVAICAAAGVVVAIHAVYDLVQVRSVVKEQNERRSRAALSLTPKLYDHGNAPGLQLSLTF